MLHHTQNTPKDWEDIFDNAAEDIGDYLQRVDAWPPDEDDLAGFELTRLLTARGRCRRAVAVIESNAPDDYRAEGEKIVRLWRRAEDRLADAAAMNPDGFEPAVKALTAQIEAADAALEETRHIVMDGFLMEDEDWLKPDFREAAHGFLLRFMGLVYCRDELNQPPMDRVATGDVNTEIDRLEALFKQRFGFFYGAADLLPILWEREYGTDVWWLTEQPDPENIPESGRAGKVIAAFMRSSPMTAGDAPEDCPMSESTLSYALGEADPEKRGEIRSHLVECRACMDLFFDARTADAAAEATGAAAVKLPLAVAAAIDAEKKTAPSLSAVDKALDYMKEAFLSFFSPKTISALAACSLVIVAAAYILIGKTGPMNATLTMIAQPAATRSAGASAPRLVRSGDVVKTGDRYRIKIKADRDGYGYVILAGSSGRVATLYSGPVRAGEAVWIPGEDEWARMDKWRGDEMVYLIVSEDEVAGFEEKAERLAEAGGEGIEAVFEGTVVERMGFAHGG